MNQHEMEQQEEMSKHETKRPKKRVKYKIDYKKLGLLFGGLLLMIALVYGGIWFFRSRDGGEIKVYDAVIQLRDRTNSDPEEDARNSAKKGDVILVRETGKEWSTTEKVSYLIIKMKLSEKEAQKIVQPKTKKLSKDEAKEKGVVNDEMLKEMEKEELNQALTQAVIFREYRVKIEDMDFDLMKVREAQPFPDKEFDWEIVEKKK
ncbi:hypothetical protein HN399_04290 [bacterium]|nr:hypothetical protein [bacterium]